MMSAVVLDTTVLSNFARVGRPDLIGLLWGHGARATDATTAEYQEGVERGIVPPGAWSGLAVETLTADEVSFAQRLPRALGPGERTAVALAFHRQMGLVTDDGPARRVALRHGIPVFGTIGILLACVRLGHLTLEEGNSLLARMIAFGFRSPAASLDSLLA